MSRFDNVGMWWEDYEAPKRADGDVRRMRNVEIPKTGWKPPKDFPNLSGADLLGIDTETKDVEMETRGPGSVRGAAHIVGVSVATRDRAWYFPMRHEHPAEKHLNMDPDCVLAWLRKEVAPLAVPKVGANLMYDYEALRAESVWPIKGPHYDVQFAAALLDENERSYSLEAIAQKELGVGKETSQLYQWCADSFGGKPNHEQRKHIWRSPPSLVGPYAESDALLPAQIFAKQLPQMREEQLTRVFEMECGLIPLLLDIRFRGVRINVERAEQVLKWLREQARKFQAELPGVDVWSGDSLARAFKREGIEHPITAAGNPSFTKEFLEHHPHPFVQAVYRVRMYEKAANPFVESYILEKHHNGRLHCQFHPLRSDIYGTVSGRFSSSNPNLQNIPSRDKVLGPMLRSIFEAEHGQLWRRGDYSQIEYRLLVHDAVGEGAEELRRRYRDDPTTDFHEATVDMVREITEVELDRKPAKNLNFGLVYGMGKDKLIRSLGVEEELGVRLYNAYFEAMPSVKDTYNSAQRLAQRRGFIRTLLGRRRRFQEFQENRYGQKERAYCHKALNARLQGSAADVMKKGMLECYKAGIYDIIGAPHLTVHDELDNSFDDHNAAHVQAYAEQKRIMETCVKVNVPLIFAESVGPNWGECA